MLKAKLSLTGAILAFVLNAGSSRASGEDGEAELDRPKAGATRGLGCVDGASFCPSFPSSLRMSREIFVSALQELAGCADSAEPVRQRLLEAGDLAATKAALAHLALADPSLSLHDIKNAVDLIAESPSPDALLGLREIYVRSEALVDRTIEREMNAAAKKKMVKRQAEELRRIVILAVAEDQSPDATALLRKAQADGGRSVAIAATRALESRGAK